MNIIARKPVRQDSKSEWIVVDRGPGTHMQFVSATADEHSLSHGEWYWGHYFTTREQAMEHFNER